MAVPEKDEQMSFVVVIAVSFLACSAVVGLLILALELNADFWFSEDAGSKNG
jgi:hypothetical protein